MENKDEVLNIFRHAKGLYRSAEKLARDAKVIRCYTCGEYHLTTERHVMLPIKENDGKSSE